MFRTLFKKFKSLQCFVTISWVLFQFLGEYGAYVKMGTQSPVACFVVAYAQGVLCAVLVRIYVLGYDFLYLTCKLDIRILMASKETGFKMLRFENMLI